MLEGELWKWTNYWNGWQLRWFILDDGILSYYKSYHEVGEGCKGSLNVSSCEIRVHPTDLLRLEISIPGEQYIYLRASSEKERQQWLIALGSAKACLKHSPNERKTSSSSHINNENNDLNGNTIKTKKSELRLYCDLLMQQVHTLKSSVANGTVDPEKLTEGSSLLAETCDTFIKTLDETMDLCDTSYTVLQQTSRRVSDQHHTKSSSSRRGRLNSDSSQSRSSVSPTPNHGFHSVFGVNHHVLYDDDDEVKRSEDTDPSWALENPFDEIDVSKSDQISTKRFLQSSESVIVIFDFLDQNAFAPIKIDVEGHIKCLYTKYYCDTTAYEYLQNIVRREIEEGVASQSASGSHALLWLVRSLMFIHNFLRRFIESDDSLEEALTVAYQSTLNSYHGWVVRNVFSVAVKSCPSREDFLKSLGLFSEQTDPERIKGIFQMKLFPRLAKYLDSMEKCLMILTQFYKTVGLD